MAENVTEDEIVAGEDMPVISPSDITAGDRVILTDKSAAKDYAMELPAPLQFGGTGAQTAEAAREKLGITALLTAQSQAIADVDAKYTDLSNATAWNAGNSSVGYGFGNARFAVFDFSASNHKTIKIKKGTHIPLDITAAGVTTRRWMNFETDTSWDLLNKMAVAAAATGTRQGQQNGRMFYVYLVPSGDGIDYTVSCNSTYPNDIDSSYTADNTRKIAWFATLCASVPSTQTAKKAASPGSVSVGGTYPYKSYAAGDADGFYNFYNKTVTAVTAGTYYDVITALHPLAGFAAGDILPESVFCLSFHPGSPADGMVYDRDTDTCVCIYLQSGRGRLTASEYAATISTPRQQANIFDDLRQVGLEELEDYAFTSAADGSNVKTNILGSADPVTTGGHTDTAGARMVSAIGCEDMCGALYQFLRCLAPDGGTEWISGDGQGNLGLCLGNSHLLLAGGAWTTTEYSGPRCRTTDFMYSGASSTIGGRGSCRTIRGA